LAGAILKLWRSIELLARLFVERIKVTNRQFAGCAIFTKVDEMLDEHSERRAPIADVVFAHHSVADGLKHAHERIADDRRAQMTNVHLFGHVWCRVVDDYRLGNHRITHAE